MSKSFTETAIIEIGKLLVPLKHLNNGRSVTDFINALGWDLRDFVFPDGEIELSNLVDHISGILDSISIIIEFDDDETVASEALDLMSKVPPAISEISNAASTIEGNLGGLSASDVTGIDDFSVIPRRIFDYLVYQYLQLNHPKIFGLLPVMGIAEIANDSADMPIRTIHWSRIPTLFSNPKEIINDVYLWDSGFDGNKFLSRLEILLRAFLIPGGIYRQNEAIRTQLGRTADDDYEEIRIPLYQTGVWSDSYVELDLNISPIPEKDSSNKAGLFLYPYIFANVAEDKENLSKLDNSENVSDEWSYQLKGNANLGAGLGIEIRPPANLDVKADIDGSAYLDLSITKKALNNQLFLIFGEQEGSRFGYKDIEFNIFLGQESGDFTFAAEALINELTLVIDSSEGDGFIQKVLSGIKLESISDLAIGISNKEGFYFKGSSALAITIPIHEQLGSVFLESVKIGVGFGDDVKIILASTFSVELGPIAGTVKEIGLEIPMSFPEDNSGNLGPLNIDGVNFLPPSGAGLAVNAGGLSGGGYLEHENGSYAGILALTFGEFSLTAIGLINTREGDYSLLVIITVEFNPEIQLSFGFSLKGVGGLIGINRSINSDFLREGLRAKTLGSILFPENPIQNASKVISDIGNGFPVYEGRFVVGPMVKIGWGGGMITADICVLIDLPSPLRIVVLGQLNAILPKPQNASGDSPQRKVVELNLDVLGEWDSGKGTLSIDATLYDSKILVYSLYGDAALRLKTGSNAYFGMSIGGFHPFFTTTCFPTITTPNCCVG